ncbi:MAG: hypothetical protein UY23_C0001G0289 [Candidatus Jorgensenbacteria bacterium GW2011_GWA1_48_11]|uniref:Type 4 prepilin-like protein leader peptide-processing enzyme n=1 Tax=Candidatus Jorgensenbacteria bacterium GW2011_GWA1_48_11 TaxID=1618660 RepID=A0A0G1WMX0_9BACT|nr:MAG: hypothetical protein UY23_C0001G0289 [Candidatus Jorgensenbacteria bacterium GW2011_GWA1_48_11]KKW12174.1 MAG: hypothetical protein UY51_C0005G0416 [Candidatus Jorgensenbacteria bacterium GW2011_GWB1_49_9]
MAYVFYLILFVLGLGFGSFLNVLAMRYDPNRSVFAPESLGGRSYCPHCHKILREFELIPILSFLFQRGRCRSCRHKLSPQYPIVEILSGLIFVSIPLFLNSFYQISNSAFINFSAPRAHYSIIFIWLVAFWVWLLIAAIDLKHYLIPNELSLVFIILAAILVMVLIFGRSWLPPFHDSFLRHYSLVFSPTQNVILNHLLGGIFGALFFYFLYFLSRGKAVGLGDAKLAGASGLLMGWPDIVLATALAFVLGGIFGAVLLIEKKKTLSSRLPFAPFLVAGFALVFFFGYSIVGGYFGLFNL